MSIPAKSGWLTKQGAGGIAGRSKFSRWQRIGLCAASVPMDNFVRRSRMLWPCSRDSFHSHLRQKTGRRDGSRLLHGNRHSRICKPSDIAAYHAEQQLSKATRAACSSGQEDTDPKGVIALKDCVSVKNADDETGKDNSFLLNAGDRTYFFVADTPGALQALSAQRTCR